MNKLVRYIFNGKNELFYLLMTLAGSFGTIMSFSYAFEFEADPWTYFTYICMTAIINAILFSAGVRLATIGVELLLLVVFIYVNSRLVAISFYGAINRVISLINSCYGLNLDMVAGGVMLDENTWHLFMMFVVVIITVLVTYILYVSESPAFGIVLTFPFAVMPIFFNTFPQLIYLLTVILFWILCLNRHSLRTVASTKNNGVFQSGVVLTIIVVALMFLCKVIISEETYKRDSVLVSLQTQINQAFLNVANDFGGNGNVAGITPDKDNSKIGDVDTLVQYGQPMVLITTDVNGKDLYLKTGVYNTYINNCWIADDKMHDESLDATYEILTLMEQYRELFEISKSENYSVTIRSGNGNSSGYVPYNAKLVKSGTISEYGYNIKVSDVSEYAKKVDLYSYIDKWRSNLIPSNITSARIYYLAEEKVRYWDYAKLFYTKVPWELVDTITIFDYVPDQRDYDEVMKYVEEVKKYFASNYTYTLSPGRTPEGRDSIEYFMTENRQGYCEHFASAATMIFRNAGIPSRYVVGYMVSKDILKSEPNTKITVQLTDKNAHAWTEIYIMDYGWIPIEVTPAYYINEQTLEHKTEATQETTAETVSKDIQETESTAEKNNNQNSKVENQGQSTVVIVFITVFITGIFITFHKAAKWYEKGRGEIETILGTTGNKSNNERCILAYEHMEALLSFMGVNIPDNLSVADIKSFLKDNVPFFSKYEIDDKIDYIIKARFSNTQVSDEETDLVCHMVLKLRKDIYQSLKGTDRFIFKYLKRL